MEEERNIADFALEFAAGYSHMEHKKEKQHKRARAVSDEDTDDDTDSETVFKVSKIKIDFEQLIIKINILESCTFEGDYSKLCTISPKERRHK